MTFDPGLLDDLEAATTEKWIGTAWHGVIGDTSPLRSNQRGARWNPAGQEALFCSLDEKTAIMELEYLLARESVLITRKRTVHRLFISLSRVVILKTGDELADRGFPKTNLLAMKFETSQLVAGYPGACNPECQIRLLELDHLP